MHSIYGFCVRHTQTHDCVIEWYISACIQRNPPARIISIAFSLSLYIWCHECYMGSCSMFRFYFHWRFHKFIVSRFPINPIHHILCTHTLLFLFIEYVDHQNYTPCTYMYLICTIRFWFAAWVYFAFNQSIRLPYLQIDFVLPPLVGKFGNHKQISIYSSQFKAVPTRSASIYFNFQFIFDIIRHLDATQSSLYQFPLQCNALEWNTSHVRIRVCVFEWAIVHSHPLTQRDGQIVFSSLFSQFSKWKIYREMGNGIKS